MDLAIQFLQMEGLLNVGPDSHNLNPHPPALQSRMSLPTELLINKSVRQQTANKSPLRGHVVTDISRELC